MKIYAITKGDYSDYHICALTVNAQKAERLKALYSSDYQDAFIEEFEDGEGMDLNLFWICDKNGCNPSFGEYNGKEQVLVNNKTNEICGVCLYAKDEQHAEKKAHDMIAEYKANKAGIC